MSDSKQPNQPKDRLRDLVAGLNPTIEIKQYGIVFSDTTDNITQNTMKLIRRETGIEELDNITMIPHLTRDNPAGFDDLAVMACFDTQGSNDPNQHIYYRGRGNKGSVRTDSSGRINMTQFVGANVGDTGQFGCSEHFKKMMSPFCKRNHEGHPILALKTTAGMPARVATLELDWRPFLAFALGITSNDPYDFALLNIAPIKNNDYTMTLMKFIVPGNAARKGRHDINYSRFAIEFNNRVNGRSGGRQY